MSEFFFFLNMWCDALLCSTKSIRILLKTGISFESKKLWETMSFKVEWTKYSKEIKPSWDNKNFCVVLMLALIYLSVLQFQRNWSFCQVKLDNFLLLFYISQSWFISLSQNSQFRYSRKGNVGKHNHFLMYH